MRTDHNFGRIGISDLESLHLGHFFDDPKFRNFNEFSASAEFGDLGVISEPARPGREFRSGRARSGSSGPAGHSWICFQNAPGFLEKPRNFSAGLENLLIFLIFLISHRVPSLASAGQGRPAQGATSLLLEITALKKCIRR